MLVFSSFHFSQLWLAWKLMNVKFDNDFKSSFICQICCAFLHFGKRFSPNICRFFFIAETNLTSSRKRSSIASMTATLKYILGAIISLHLCVFLSPIVHIVKILFLRVLRSMQVWCWAWLSDLPYNFYSVDYLLTASGLLCSLSQLERVWLNKRKLC